MSRSAAPRPLERMRSFFEARTEEPLFVRFAGFDVAAFTLPCPTIEDRVNEDAVTLIPVTEESGVLGLADGMGGGRDGATAARIALERLATEVRRAAGEGNKLRVGVLNGFEAANRDVAALGTGGATTLVAAELSADAVRIYHVGDSEAAVVGQRGKLKLQIVSHTPAGYAREAGVINEKQALEHKHRHLLLNLIGSAEMRIDVGPPLRFASRDTLILGSDGLFDNFKLERILKSIRRGALDNVARELAGAVVERMRNPPPDVPSKPDDFSFLLARRVAPPRRPRRVEKAQTPEPAPRNPPPT